MPVMPDIAPLAIDGVITLLISHASLLGYRWMIAVVDV